MLARGIFEKVYVFSWLLVVQAAALTVLVTQGSIFEPLREHGPQLWRKLVVCPLCLGTWFGAGSLVLQALLARISPSISLCWDVAAAGALSGCLALFYRHVSDWFNSSALALDAQAELARRAAKAARKETDS